MTRRPGQRGTRLAREQRAKRLLEKTTLEGKTMTQAAKEEGIARETGHRTLQTMTKKFVEQNNDALVEIKQKIAEEYLDKANDVLAGRVHPDVMNAWSRVMRDFKNLLGLDAAKRAIVGHVSAEIDPQKLVGYRRWIHETRFLSESKYHLVWDFIRTIEELPGSKPMAGPPEDSPLWHDDEELQLEGEVE